MTIHLPPLTREMTIQRVQALLSQYIHLEEKNAKERKAERSRQRKLGKKCIGPARANPPPKFCNRAGSAWNDAPYPCECGKWPQWIAEAPLELCKSKKTGTAQDGSIIDLEKVYAKEESVAFWRPGGHNKKENYYYNGVLTNIYEVVLPDRVAPVVVFAINWHAFTTSEEQHFVTSIDVNSGPFSKYPHDKIWNKAHQNIRCEQPP